MYGYCQVEGCNDLTVGFLSVPIGKGKLSTKMELCASHFEELVREKKSVRRKESVEDDGLEGRPE